MRFLLDKSCPSTAYLLGNDIVQVVYLFTLQAEVVAKGGRVLPMAGSLMIVSIQMASGEGASPHSGYDALFPDSAAMIVKPMKIRVEKKIHD